MEAVGLNRWFVNACREAGLDVLVCDPRKLDKLGKKTDRRDAREMARRLWLGDLDRMARTYYPSDAEYGRRKLLRVRRRLVQMRQQTINQLRGMLHAYQIPAPRGVLYTGPSRKRLASVQLPVAELQQAFEALLAVLEGLQGQIAALNRRVRRLPREEAEVAVLATEIPGIGAPSAATLLAELGDVRRFQWAVRLMKDNPLVRAWAQRLRRRVHKNKARMALARRLLVGLWVTLTRGEAFDLERCLGRA